MSERPRLEVAEVFRRYRDEFRQTSRISSAQTRVLDALSACRTALLGGHVDRCDTCAHERISYNSCRNRHCPKCQGSATAQWLESERRHLLPVPYAHVVFTLPHTLAPLALQNPRILYSLLFRAAAHALLDLAADPRHLGGRIGFLLILHTWGQTLLHHPHVHGLVPAGALSADGERWIACRPGFFLPVRALSRLFRGQYLSLLTKSFAEGRLSFHGSLAHLKEPSAFEGLLRTARRNDWVVYAKPPFGGPDPALKYLARYTHRVALSNARLRSVENGSVTFTWKDYAHGGRERLMVLPASEFIRRFLLHVLPRGFVRIRRYGFLSNRERGTLLPRCRTLLGEERSATPPPAEAHEAERHEAAAQPSEDVGPARCPVCRRGELRPVQILKPVKCQTTEPPPAQDSS